MIAKDNPTRDRLIAIGLKSLVLHGFEGVGLNAILHAAGVPKGSFYYFFKSKEDFARAVLDAYERRADEQQGAILKDTSRSPMKRLHDYFDVIGRGHLAEAPLGGCLFGVLSQTAAARSPEFKARLAQVFSTWEAELAQLLEEAKSAGEVDIGLDTREAAAFLIDSFEGMLVRLKVDGDPSALRRFKRMALDPLDLRRSAG
ncbi:TetR family transcriptional regulator C-terminal domain-containing protein [Aestuariivirga sp.]|uniref:TetR/AcrR family transcriptional regulator n=1 Tax=Aestuariivirga sp. TaxID=2650926 RepID=UPI0039192612